MTGQSTWGLAVTTGSWAGERQYEGWHAPTGLGHRPLPPGEGSGPPSQPQTWGAEPPHRRGALPLPPALPNQTSKSHHPRPALLSQGRCGGRRDGRQEGFLQGEVLSPQSPRCWPVLSPASPSQTRQGQLESAGRPWGTTPLHRNSGPRLQPQDGSSRGSLGRAEAGRARPHLKVPAWLSTGRPNPLGPLPEHVSAPKMPGMAGGFGPQGGPLKAGSTDLETSTPPGARRGGLSHPARNCRMPMRGAAAKLSTTPEGTRLGVTWRDAG